MSNLIEKLEEEITEQTRNGRTEIYISTDDLETLGMTPFENKGRVYIEIDELNKLIEIYKGKEEER